MLKGIRNGAKLHVIDPRRTSSAQWADTWLGLDVGSDISLANAMAREIIHAGMANEKFIGPIFDESGIRFFLVYNSKLKLFMYILDETVKVADQFFHSPSTDRILIGKRTGFAFYRDHHMDRKIMIGAYEENIRLNNYFGGPFDQLPDNFIEGETLRDAILHVQPDLKGEIDFG